MGSVVEFSRVIPESEQPFEPKPIDMAEAFAVVRDLRGMTEHSRRYRSALRCGHTWRLLAARAGVLTPGLVKRAKAWKDRRVETSRCVLGVMMGSPTYPDTDPRAVWSALVYEDGDCLACGIAGTEAEAIERADAHAKAGTTDNGRHWWEHEARIFGDRFTSYEDLAKIRGTVTDA
jgi:hypothetical protein